MDFFAKGMGGLIHELENKMKLYDEHKKGKGRGYLSSSQTNQLGQFCVRICVRKTFQNVLKYAKIGKNMKSQK